MTDTHYLIPNTQYLIPSFNRYFNPKFSTTQITVRDSYSPPMIRNDSMAYTQADAGTVRFGGEVWIEYFGKVIFQKIFHPVAPSTRAASSRSSGMPTSVA